MTAPVRDEATVSGELRSLRSLNVETEVQLARVRATMAEKLAQIAVLEVHEFSLVAAYDGRKRKIDRLLDEMLTMRAGA